MPEKFRPAGGPLLDPSEIDPENDTINMKKTQVELEVELISAVRADNLGIKNSEIDTLWEQIHAIEMMLINRSPVRCTWDHEDSKKRLRHKRLAKVLPGGGTVKRRRLYSEVY